MNESEGDLVGISFLVQEQCPIVEKMIKCLQWPINILKDGYCPPFWELGVCIEGTKFGEDKVTPCFYNLHFDPDGKLISDWGENARIIKHCNQSTKTWNKEIDQTCVTYEQDNSTSLLPTFKGVIKKPPTTEIYRTIKFITNISYSISLAALVVAIILFLTLRRLRCTRVTIHINLMLTFCLRAIVFYLSTPIEELQVNSNLVSNLYAGIWNIDDYDTILYAYNTVCFHNKQCWIYNLLFDYVIIANYFWILIEGIYLWMLLRAFSMPSKKTLTIFLVFGWFFPLVPSLIYGIYAKKDCFEMTVCEGGFWWVLKGPILLSLGTNFVIFIMVLRLVASKLRFNLNTGSANNYKWRLTKATLSLIPLLGISYLLTIFVQCNQYEHTGFIIVKFIEVFFTSIQGFLVAVIYCFLNSEIQEELSKLKRNWKLKKELKQLQADHKSGPSHANYSNQEASNMTNVTSWIDREKIDEPVNQCLLPSSKEKPKKTQTEESIETKAEKKVSASHKINIQDLEDSSSL